MKLNIFRKFSNRKTKDPGLRLDMAERAINLPNQYFKDFVESLSQEDFLCYPSESEYHDLKRDLSKLENISPQNISLGFGSDQIIKNIFHLYAQKNSKAIYNLPSFPMYKVYADTFGLISKTIEYNASLDFPIDQMLKQIDNKASLVVLANPNSPFGSIKGLRDIRALCVELKKYDGAVLLDEAYIDFGGRTSAQLVSVFDNLIICKTFSKAWGAAGARFGYAIANPSVIDNLEKLRPSFPLTGVTIKYIKFLIEHNHIKEQYVQSIIEERNILKKSPLNKNFDIKYGDVSWVHINDKEDNIFLDKLLKSNKISYKNRLVLPHDSRENWIRLGLKQGITGFLENENFINRG